MSNKKLMLCQNCLRVADFDQAGHAEEYFCDCGGQWCGCNDCHETATKLRGGVRDAQQLGLTITGAITWDEKDGRITTH